MKTINFAVGWPIKEGPELFLDALKVECKARGLSFAVIYEDSLRRLKELVKRKRIRINFFLDMASETHNKEDEFTKFVYALKDAGTIVVADPDHVRFSADKAITHFNLIKAKVPVPFTIVIRNWEPTRRLTDEEKKHLGLPFVVKPGMGYGQQGVKIIHKRFSLKEIAQARKFNVGDNFLLQAYIDPLILAGAPAWFRVFQLFGEIFPCWWDPQTKAYRQVTLREFIQYQLSPLVLISSQIANITKIEWFSSEIAINAKTKKFVVVDYMNDQCAMYPKSHHRDGVPDELIILIARRMVVRAWEYVRETFVMPHHAIWFPHSKAPDENIQA